MLCKFVMHRGAILFPLQIFVLECIFFKVLIIFVYIQCVIILLVFTYFTH